MANSGRGWVRLGDINSVNAPVIGAVATSVIVNKKPAALQGSIIQTHLPPFPPSPPHANSVIKVGASTVIAEGKPAAFNGAGESCGHSQAQASPDVIIPGA